MRAGPYKEQCLSQSVVRNFSEKKSLVDHDFFYLFYATTRTGKIKQIVESSALKYDRREGKRSLLSSIDTFRCPYIRVLKFFFFYYHLRSTVKREHVVNFVQHALHVTNTCHISLTNIHCFVPQMKHLYWSSRYSCLGNCPVWKLNLCEKTFTLHGWTQMVVI